MKNKEIYTTITAGIHKGKKIKIPAIGTTRSTKSILKGSFFDSIQFEIRDHIFVEVFGGSGSMGLEALSLGAKKAYFIEKNATAFEILRFNCAQIDKNNTICKRADSFEYFETLLSRIDSKSFFYFDPPFSIRDGMDDVYEKVYQLIGMIPTSKVALITIEHMCTLKIPKNVAPFMLQKSKKFGKSSLSYYR